MLANYIYKLGAVTEINDHVEETKENTTGSPLSSTSLSVNVKDFWGNVGIHQCKTSRMSEGSETHPRICNIVINRHDEFGTELCPEIFVLYGNLSLRWRFNSSFPSMLQGLLKTYRKS